MKTQQELYRDFLEFVARDIQKERVLLNRRMLSVFIWCFVFPLMTSGTVLIFAKLQLLPRSAKNHADLLIVLFPVLYSLYFLGSEVLFQIPKVIKKGGVFATLGQSVTEGQWRERVCAAMGTQITASPQDWHWIIESFKVDLRSMRYRTKHLTVLGGAVFFLLMRGIDSLGELESKPMWVKSPVFGWVDSSSDLSQFVGLALFLTLLYLSGTQTHQSFYRYLNCAILLQLQTEKKRSN
ncbi:MAG: hypothetical protein ACO3A2_08665 [Bdellovibrionia bacterium]